MFVQVEHDVLDRDGWKKLSSEWSGPPPGYTLLSSVTTKDHAKMFCLWEVDSVEALSTVLDAQTKSVLKNTYFAIDDKAPLTTLPHEAVAR
ncbi:MAG TPA: hypothetical protein VGZ02_12060 [Candidatus Baltobacteraceae bacterium]|jgi:hypothetical protein|nr:hypothetical protein [Candidatus Baltobacteraceae bacterium]